MILEEIRCSYSATITTINQWGNIMSEFKKVVCVDDEAEMIDLVKFILAREQFVVTGASDGMTGLKVIKEVQPDLVILDLMMPEMDGWEVYQHMQANKNMADIPVIILTAKAQSIDRVLGLHIARVNAYLTKPFKPQELTETIDRVLTKSERGK